MTSFGSAAAAAEAEALCTALAERDVEAVALVYTDHAGVPRMKGVPLARLPGAAAEGVGMSPVFDAFLPDDSITTSPSAGGPVGDLRLVPDLAGLVVLAAQPGWAWAPVERWTQDGRRHDQCQRHALVRTLDRAAARGLRLRAGFELEWVVGTGADGFVPATTAPAYGTTRVVELSDYTVDLLRALRLQGHQVAQFHPEYAPGQFELSLLPADPVAAADATLVVRDTVRAVGHRHGLRTTFSPAVIPGGVGNGGHLHLSLGRDGRNLMGGGDGPHGLTGEAEAFIAGVLAALPALLAVGAPSVASYQRLVPGHWAGPYRCWGHENREAAVRLITGAHPDEANVEVKVFDATANPYLLIAAVVAAGLAGLDDDRRLPPGIDVDPASLTGPQRQQRGVERLPDRLEDATDVLEQDAVVRDAFGTALFETVIAVRRAECARFAGVGAEDVIAASRWTH